MKTFLSILFILFSELCFSQLTFSKLINLDIAKDNFLLDLEKNDSFLIATTKHLCKQDSANNIFITCTGISKFILSGELIHNILLDSFYPEGLNRLQLDNGKILLTGHFHNDYEGRSTVLMEFDSNFELDTSYLFTNENNSIVNNEGIIKYKGNYYLYGTKFIIDESKKYSNVIKISPEGQVVWNKLFSRGTKNNEIFDLQGTSDGNLMYFQYFNGGAGSSGQSGFELVKIDTNGIFLDSFEFEDISIDNPRFLAASDGSIYFTSQSSPIPHSFPSSGRVNKIDSNLDSIDWSFRLPTIPFIDGHRFKVYDYLESSNGDILVCGTVWEEGPDGPTGTPDNHTWNGFITRITTTGELVWLRIYRHPNNHPLLQSPEFGDFRPSYLTKIYETQDNSFVVAGSVYYDSYQEINLPENENKSSIWLMRVNQSGCIENEECTETIILNGENPLMLKFEIGTKWTYEVEEFPDPIVTSFRTFIITDTTIINSKKVFVIENNFDNLKEYMYVDGSKIYFWDTQLEAFQLNFDFAETIQYQIPWIGLCDPNTGTILVHIDSITELVLNADTISVQHISVEGEGSIPFAEVYQNIGIADRGLRFPVGIGLCDFNPHVTKLRCFESDTINYHFVNYPCDSIWIATAIEPYKIEIGKIYPNPTSGLIYFETDDLPIQYELFEITGQLIERGLVADQKLHVQRKGIFILKYFSNHTFKIVKLLSI